MVVVLFALSLLYSRPPDGLIRKWIYVRMYT